jgi:hypothetical protein
VKFLKPPQLTTSPTSGPCLIKQEKKKKQVGASLDNDRGEDRWDCPRVDVPENRELTEQMYTYI